MALDVLFGGEDLSGLFTLHKKQIETIINSYNHDYILNANEEDLCRYLISKYSLEAPILHEEDIYEESPKELIVPENGIRATRITIKIPFEGSGYLLFYRPSHYTLSPVLGNISEHDIILTYNIFKHDSEKLKNLYDKTLEEIKKYLSWMEQDIEKFNRSIDLFVRELVAQRKEKILKDLNLAESLGIPMKRSNDLSKTYTVPIIRKEPKFELPKVKKEFFKPEPTLAESEYKYILKVLYDMTLVMERSPKTFSKLKEEEIRDFFLIVLNSHYEGLATGETFNFGGKTDILVRVNDKNAFIAECKFWRGEKKLIEGIDQLLGYTSWRDTKTAILLFNKNTNFSSVLDKIDPTVKSHNCYKRKYNFKKNNLKSKTVFSYIFHQPDDRNKELFLTIMAFNIPK